MPGLRAMAQTKTGQPQVWRGEFFLPTDIREAEILVGECTKQRTVKSDLPKVDNERQLRASREELSAPLKKKRKTR